MPNTTGETVDRTKKVAPTCPYFHRKAQVIKIQTKEERFDFQIAEGGKIERVSLGVFDCVKEVNSHNGEVGLINVIKLATAKGIPLDSFAKTEPGLYVDLSGIETVEDLVAKEKAVDTKLEEFAKVLGVSKDDLITAIKNGTVADLQKPVSEDKDDDKGDGE